MIDSHAHINAFHTIDQAAMVASRFFAVQGTHIVTVATELADCADIISVAKLFPNQISISSGLHPENIVKLLQENKDTTQTSAEFFSMIDAFKKAELRIVAIGETGFDIYNTELDTNKVWEAQELLFKTHIAYAKENKLPVVIHARGKTTSDFSSHEKTISVIKNNAADIPYYFHSFGGDKELLSHILGVNGYIGINGIITYQNVDSIKEALLTAPLDKIVLETDSPFLVPSNMDRSLLLDKKTNEPIAIPLIAKMLAKILNLPVEQILEQTTANSKKLFNL